MDLDALELFMRQIYKKHPCNVLYNQHLPVYISPENPQKIISITNAAFTAWAKNLALASYFNDHQVASSITGSRDQLSGGSNTASAAKDSNIHDYIKFIGL
ncbi:hypothetical protein VP01_2055g2 [Puccinia sorghi]|uniref:Uncharacterized protein n=1 Tax=Puccinia sorghi TaxID=27349 RepID=A0A0L6VBE0_9BASI|nr:hypothetical protein VP01_2055g2 [Puccinia sorghi]